MASTLRIGPVAADQPIVPGDPDDIGGIAGPAGVKNDALRIIKANAAAYEKLGPALAIPPDVERTRVANQHLDEVSDATGLDVRGVTIRGSGEGPRVATYVFVKRNPDGTDGRSGKGMVPYSELPKMERAFQEDRKRRLDAAKAARKAGGDESVFGEDPRVAALSDEIERLQRELKARDEVPEAPEPLEGYADLSVEDVENAISAVEDPVEREILKRNVRAYEQDLKGSKARKGVLAATEPSRLVPADE